MKALFFQAGRPIVADVPAPQAEKGRILVAVKYSAVSPGTELGALARSGRSLLSRALDKRHKSDRLRQVIQQRDLNDLRTRIDRLARGRDAWLAPGYSAAGVVLERGPESENFGPGDRVAVAGAGYANHAEWVSVPRNLTVRVPSGLDLLPASTVAMGAIALQAVRRAGSALGEVVLVLGLGLLGQLVARILLAGGCRVLAWDRDPQRLALGEACGLEALRIETFEEIPSAVLGATNGRGVDQSIVAASGGGEIVESAAASTRKAGVLVLLGETPVFAPREVAYERELSIRMSTSYGPGRYDPRYEEDGAEYPYAYVRWTENRNMAAYLALVAAGKVEVRSLLREVAGLEQAAEAYADLRAGRTVPPGLVFRYDGAGSAVAQGGEPGPALTSAISPKAAPLKIALLGTGAYAAEGILPTLSKLEKSGGQVRFELLVGNNPARREPLARRFGFLQTGSDPEAAAVNPAVDLVVIATRHDRHAGLVVKALEAGRAVFCEKPLALAAQEVEQIESSLRRGSGFLVLGFNRRFAPAVAKLREELSRRRGPLLLSYRVQAGPLPEGHWIRGSEGGGRLIGEAVHMVDLLRHLVGAPLVRAWVLPTGSGVENDPAADNFHLGLSYEDGSSATLLYTSRGSPNHPKERLEVHGDGRSFEIDDFVLLRESGRSAPRWKASAPDKGREGLWRAAVLALISGAPSPTPLDEILETSRAVIALDQSLRSLSASASPTPLSTSDS